MNLEEIPFPNPQVGMWQIKSKEDGKIEIFQWNQDSVIKFEMAQCDTSKFIAALMFHQEEALVRTGMDERKARDIIWEDWMKWFKKYVMDAIERIEKLR